MSLKSAFRRLSRAFSANDAKAFDDALEELEEGMEPEQKDAEEDPDTIEVHNHIPGQADAARGQMPEKDPPGFDSRQDDRRHDDRRHDDRRDRRHDDRRDRRHDDRRHDDRRDMMDRLDRCMDEMAALKKWAEEEGQEPEHQDGDPLENLGGASEMPEKDFNEQGEANLEMEDRYHDDDMHYDRRDRRHDDRRHDDRRDRRHDDRRDRRHDDEANKKILGELEFEAPPGTGVDAKRATDSRYLKDAFQDTVAKAEILAPGIKIPTFDQAAPPVRTVRALLSLRRAALDVAYNESATRSVIDTAMNGRTLDTKTIDFGATRVLFNAVAGAVAAGNNHRATDGSGSVVNRGGAGGVEPRIKTLADLNRANRERFGRKTA